MEMKEKMEEKEELLRELRERLKGREPFYLTGVVSSPYSGCVYEPQIWVVDPVDEEQLVKPLYASGQGVALEEMGAKELLLTVENDYAHSETPGFRGGRIDDWEIGGPISKPINDCVPSIEHYWGNAVEAGLREHGLNLRWRCPECGEVIEYDGDMSTTPVFTGYRGNGGIGIFQTGVMCGDCFYQGVPVCCEGASPESAYDAGVAKEGWTFCSHHAEEILKDIGARGGFILRMSDEEMDELLEEIDDADAVLIKNVEVESLILPGLEGHTPKFRTQMVLVKEAEGDRQEKILDLEKVGIVRAALMQVLEDTLRSMPDTMDFDDRYDACIWLQPEVVERVLDAYADQIEEEKDEN